MPAISSRTPDPFAKTPMPTISSRTPEGQPYRCPLCGETALLEPSVMGDVCCPRCGTLIWQVRDRLREFLAEQLGVAPEKLTMQDSFVNELGADSLDQVALVMELEEEFDINIPEDAAEQIQTVDQAIRYIARLLRERQNRPPPDL